MRYNSPGIRESTPGIARLFKRAERRGMRYSSPGTGRESETAERPGIRNDVQSSRFWTPRSFACPPNGLAFSCRARWTVPLKKQRSRARSGQLQCRVRRGRRAARLPIPSRRGICRELEIADRPGIRYTTLGISSSTPAICRACE